MNGELVRLREISARLHDHRRAEHALLIELIDEVRAIKEAMQSVHNAMKTDVVEPRHVIKLHTAATRSDYLEMVLTSWAKRSEEPT